MTRYSAETVNVRSVDDRPPGPPPGWEDMPPPIERLGPSWEEAPRLPQPVDWSALWASDDTAGDFLVDPILPRGRSVALYAPAKAGKSLLMLNVAAAVATGQAVLDRPAGRAEHVVYIDLEMSEDDLRDRLSEMGYGPETDLSFLHYYLLPDLPALDTALGGDTALAVALRHRAALFIVDTVGRALTGPENDADTLRAFARHTGQPLKAKGITVVRLDHAGKDTTRGQRGTSAKNDDVDVVWSLNAGDGGVTLTATHRRMSWVPERVELGVFTDPLIHRLGVPQWPAGTKETADTLDLLGVPLDASRRAAQVALRDSGKGTRALLVGSALKYRKLTALEPPPA